MVKQPKSNPPCTISNTYSPIPIAISSGFSPSSSSFLQIQVVLHGSASWPRSKAMSLYWCDPAARPCSSVGMTLFQEHIAGRLFARSLDMFRPISLIGEFSVSLSFSIALHHMIFVTHWGQCVIQVWGGIYVFELWLSQVFAKLSLIIFVASKIAKFEKKDHEKKKNIINSNR
ncbi:hypothetical protein HanPI659440_Chr07g0254661 [Helianthus annuus]|nr:hypothetical protein HanPI659440_Chr07g0254661 [Helianthus annuus]